MLHRQVYRRYSHQAGLSPLVAVQVETNAMASQIVNGVWQSELIPRERSVVNAPLTFDRAVAVLTEILVMSQNFSDADRRRMASFVLATGDLLTSRNRLQGEDRALFDALLRDTLARRKDHE